VPIHRDELTKLMQAHYAGAVPLDLLASEQDRIACRLAFLDAQINAGDIEYEQAKSHLDDCLALAGDMHAIYMSIDDSLRRIANQAFFDKLIVTDDDTIHSEPGVPSNVFLDRDVQTLAIRQQGQTTESGTQTGDVVGLNNDLLVEPRGLEPLTPCLQILVTACFQQKPMPLAFYFTVSDGQEWSSVWHQSGTTRGILRPERS
jgi:site-specific DNA recombinase